MCRRRRKYQVFHMQRKNRSSTWKMCFRRGRTANQVITKVSFPSPKAVVSLELDQAEKLQVCFIHRTHQLLENSSSSHPPLQKPEKVIFLCIKLSPVNKHFPEELSYQEWGKVTPFKPRLFPPYFFFLFVFPFAFFNLRFSCPFSLASF